MSGHSVGMACAPSDGRSDAHRKRPLRGWSLTNLLAHEQLGHSLFRGWSLPRRRRGADCRSGCDPKAAASVLRWSVLSSSRGLSSSTTVLDPDGSPSPRGADLRRGRWIFMRRWWPGSVESLNAPLWVGLGWYRRSPRPERSFLDYVSV